MSRKLETIYFLGVALVVSVNIHKNSTYVENFEIYKEAHHKFLWFYTLTSACFPLPFILDVFVVLKNHDYI